MSARKINQNENLWLYLFSGVTLVIVCAVRLRLLGVSLERDEGEYAYIGQQLLNGALPYADSYSMKFPGIYLVYAFILVIFGQTHTGIHLALLLTNIASAFLLFQIGGRLFNKTVAISAGSCFLVMTLNPSVQGLWANAEHFVVLFALGGLLLMLVALEKDSRQQLFLSGMLLGFALLVKQHGGFFCLFAFLYVVLFYLKKRAEVRTHKMLKVGLFVLGGLTPIALTALFYFVANRFDAFWFWTFSYASEYVSLHSASQGISAFFNRFNKILESNFLILLLSLLGLAFVALDKRIKDKDIFSVGFLIISFLAIIPGLYFRGHYFILWIPALSLFAGMGLSGILSGLTSHRLKMASAVCILCISFGVVFYKDENLFFTSSTVEATRYVYGPNPFTESLPIAEYINKNTEEKDEVAILGSEPQIHFYAKRRSATGFLYMYPLMENQKYARWMQEMMIKEVESHQPKIIVFADIKASWVKNSFSDPLLTNWADDYIKKNYDLTGLAFILFRKKTIYKWGINPVKKFLPIMKSYPDNQRLLVYKRKI